MILDEFKTILKNKEQLYDYTIDLCETCPLNFLPYDESISISRDDINIKRCSFCFRIFLYALDDLSKDLSQEMVDYAKEVSKNLTSFSLNCRSKNNNIIAHMIEFYENNFKNQILELE